MENLTNSSPEKFENDSDFLYLNPEEQISLLADIILDLLLNEIGKTEKKEDTDYDARFKSVRTTRQPLGSKRKHKPGKHFIKKG